MIYDLNQALGISSDSERIKASFRLYPAPYKADYIIDPVAYSEYCAFYCLREIVVQAFRKIMLFYGYRYGFFFSAFDAVFHPHRALQARKLAHHLRDKVCLA